MFLPASLELKNSVAQRLDFVVSHIFLKLYISKDKLLFFLCYYCRMLIKGDCRGVLLLCNMMFVASNTSVCCDVVMD